MPTEKIYSEVKEIPKEGEVKDLPGIYSPKEDEKTKRDYIKKRILIMQEARKNVLGKNIETIWKDADKDYQPKELESETTRKIFESSDTLGLRSRLVQVGDKTEAWRNKNSEPTLLVKIQTALSIIIDRNPEAVFESLTKKYEVTTKLAHSLWQSSWKIDQSKGQLKLFVFNLAKYGWACGRTYPRIIKRNKSILTKLDTEHPEKNEYEEKVIVDFNGVHRENLDPYKVWVDEMAVPNDPHSINDWYFEKDYNYDSAMLEFGHYANWDFVQKSAKKINESEDKEKTTENKEIVTIGFYENKNKDLYGIYIPSQDILLYSSPNPNDDGKLSLWQTYWNLRDARTIFGIGLWEIIKQKKGLYDKMVNMTMDQLVLAIYKMFFYSGTNTQLGDGTIKITPGKGFQNLGGKVDFLEVPGPGNESWEGLKFIKSGMDDDSGVTPTLEGDITGKTLGEILHAKEAALKRLSLPIDNIADALSNEAYISLSWLAQTLSVPEVQEFANESELLAYEKETELNHFELSSTQDEFGNTTGLTASFLPEVALNLKKDEDNETLIEDKEKRFFQIGKEIPIHQLRWEGIITVKPGSILSPSIELEKQRKNAVANLLVPLFQGPPDLFLKPAIQILKINDEDPEDWLPQTWLDFMQGKPLPQPEQPLFVPENPETMQNKAGLSPKSSQTVVPKSEVGLPGQTDIAGKVKQTMGAFFKQ